MVDQKSHKEGGGEPSEEQGKRGGGKYAGGSRDRRTSFFIVKGSLEPTLSNRS